jgi:dolichyl-phosphate beta-glucosyltransferase
MLQFGVAVLVGGVSVLFLLLRLLSPTPRKPEAQEWKFIDNHGEQQSFPHLINAPSKELVELSVIIPAYNEVDRLPVMMEETLEYLDKRLENDSLFSCEVILVDDASKDQTSDLGFQIQKSAKRFENRKSIRVMTHKTNRGKGGAVMRVFIHNNREFLLVEENMCCL